MRKGKKLNMHKRVDETLIKPDFENGFSQVFMGCSTLALTMLGTRKMTANKNQLMICLARHQSFSEAGNQNNFGCKHRHS